MVLINAQHQNSKPWEVGLLKKNIIIQQLSEAVNCETIELKEPKLGENISFAKLIRNEPKLFFRFKENHCDGCVQSSIRLLSQLSDSVPDIEISILCGYNNVRQFQAYAQANRKQFEVYNINEMPLAAEIQEQPYFFVVTPDYRIRNVFITTKEDEHFTENYLAAIQNKYWHIHDHNCDEHHNDCDLHRHHHH